MVGVTKTVTPKSKPYRGLDILDRWAKGGDIQNLIFGHFGHLVRLQISPPRTMGVTEKRSSLWPRPPTAGGRIALNHLPEVLNRPDWQVPGSFPPRGPGTLNHPQEVCRIHQPPNTSRRR